MPYDEIHHAWEFWACIDDIDKPITETFRYRTKQALKHVKRNAFAYGTLAVSIISMATALILGT